MTQHYHLWESIDFNDMKDLFGGEINDDNIRWVLQCIDAVHHLKTLKLTNCFGVVGIGLQPLMGSTVLESVDLSLVGVNESPSINPEPPISAEVVVPILESIIDTEGNELVTVTLPKKWRVEKSDVLTNFLRKFGRVLGSRNIKCSAYRCDKICEAGRTRMGGNSLVCCDTEQNQYGINIFACSKCDRKYCAECQDGELYNFCEVCEKFYCDYCAEMNWCDGENCNKTGHTCRKCAPNELRLCDGCGEVEYCPECEPEWIECQYCDNIKICSRDCAHGSYKLDICEGEGCNRANCTDCFANNGSVEYVTQCTGFDGSGNGHNEACHTQFCIDCRAKELESMKWRAECCERLREEIEKLRMG